MSRKRILLFIIGFFIFIIISLILLRKYNPDNFKKIMKNYPLLKNFYISVRGGYCDFIENEYFVYTTDQCGGPVDCSKEEKYIDMTSQIPFTQVQINKSECGPPDEDYIKKICQDEGYTWNGTNCYQIFKLDKIEFDIKKIKYDLDKKQLIIPIKIPQGIKKREANKMINFNKILLEIPKGDNTFQIEPLDISIEDINKEIDNILIFDLKKCPYSLIPSSYPKTRILLETNIYNLKLKSNEFTLDIPENKINFKAEFIVKKDFIVTDVKKLQEIYTNPKFLNNVVNTYMDILKSNNQYLLNPNYEKIMKEKKPVFDLIIAWTIPSKIDVGEDIYGFKYNLIKLINGKKIKLLDRKNSIIIDEKKEEADKINEGIEEPLEEKATDETNIEEAEENMFKNQRYVNMYEQDLKYYKFLKKKIREDQEFYGGKLSDQNILKDFVPLNFQEIFIIFYTMDNKNAINYDEYKIEIKKIEKKLEDQENENIKDQVENIRDAHMDRYVIDVVYPGDNILYILDIFPVTKDMPNGNISYSSQIELNVKIPTLELNPSLCNFIPNSDDPIQSYIFKNNKCQIPNQLDNEFYCTFKYNNGLGLYQQNKCYLAKKSYFDFMENNQLIKKERELLSIDINTVELYDNGQMMPRSNFNFKFEGFPLERYEYMMYLRKLFNNQFDINKFDLNNLDYEKVINDYKKIEKICTDKINKLQEYHSSFSGRSPEEDKAWMKFQDAKFEDNLLYQDENYYLNELKNRFNLISNGLVINDGNQYVPRDNLFDFKIFEDDRYRSLANLRKSSQIEDKALIKIDSLNNDYNIQIKKADKILSKLMNEDIQFYNLVKQEDDILRTEESTLIRKITFDLEKYMKNKVETYLNPCVNKKIPVCKKINANRTIKVHKPHSNSGISIKHLEKEDVTEFWNTRDSFEWYKVKQFKDPIVLDQDINEINNKYFANFDHINTIWNKNKLSNLFKFTKKDNQEFVNYNIEGECYNPDSNSKNCCNNNGIFNITTGKCECKKGWQGTNCTRCTLPICD